MDERNRNSKRTEIRTQTPTGKALKSLRTQHNDGIMLSLAVSLETRIMGPVVVEPGIESVGRLLLGYFEGPVDAHGPTHFLTCCRRLRVCGWKTHSKAC